MQILGKFGGKTKLIIYIFCPPPPLFKKRSRATGHHPPTFRLVEAPSGSIMDPQCSLASVFVVVPPTFSLFLSQVKLVWETFSEAFCLHGQTI